MREPLAGRVLHSRARQRIGKLEASEVFSTSQGIGDRIMISTDGPRIDAEIPSVVRHRLLYARGSEREHPPNVFRRNEVPSRTQNVRPQDLSLVDLPIDVSFSLDARPHPQRPFRARVVLSLDGPERSDDVVRRRWAPNSEKLTRKPSANDLAVAAFAVTALR
jgi:hypothetical protein